MIYMNLHDEKKGNATISWSLSGGLDEILMERREQAKSTMKFG
jgi:hypothetical protein